MLTYKLNFFINRIFSAVELIFLEKRADSLDEYKIVKAIKHTCAEVTLYVPYKMTSNQLYINLGFPKYRSQRDLQIYIANLLYNIKI